MTKGIKTSQLIVAFIISGCTIFYLVMLPNTYSQFSETFTSFGAELPLATVLALKYSYLTFLFIPVPIVHFTLSYQKNNRSEFSKVIWKQFGFLIIIIVITISLMYLPIFSIG